jgi:enamine deaminase RidA (YjgF/YER057c/UK114 family)
MTINITLQSEGLAGRYEELAGHSRLRRVGDHIAIGGTAALQSDGTLHCPHDGYEQSLFILTKFARLLEEAGAGLEHVVRIRAFFANPAVVTEFGRAHKQFFDDIRPCLTGTMAGLWEDGMMLELELDAIVT